MVKMTFQGRDGDHIKADHGGQTCWIEARDEHGMEATFFLTELQAGQIAGLLLEHYPEVKMQLQAQWAIEAALADTHETEKAIAQLMAGDYSGFVKDAAKAHAASIGGTNEQS